MPLSKTEGYKAKEISCATQPPNPHMEENNPENLKGNIVTASGMSLVWSGSLHCRSSSTGRWHCLISWLEAQIQCVLPQIVSTLTFNQEANANNGRKQNCQQRAKPHQPDNLINFMRGARDFFFLFSPSSLHLCCKVFDSGVIASRESAGVKLMDPELIFTDTLSKLNERSKRKPRWTQQERVIARRCTRQAAAARRPSVRHASLWNGKYCLWDVRKPDELQECAAWNDCDGTIAGP